MFCMVDSGAIYFISLTINPMGDSTKANKYEKGSKPTFYDCILFRSRLEAKWACFFDTVGISWEYEPFDLPGWSPDFIIRRSGREFLAEIKPEIYQDDTMIRKIIKATRKEVLIFSESIMPDSSGGYAYGALGIKILNYTPVQDYLTFLNIDKPEDHRPGGIYNPFIKIEDRWHVRPEELYYDCSGHAVVFSPLGERPSDLILNLLVSPDQLLTAWRKTQKKTMFLPIKD